MPLQFAATLFLSATLLFMVQPMVGKMVLPLLGGSPAVWNACMVFFQALLLLGYMYAHWLTTKFEPKQQWKVHFAVLLLPVAAMALGAAFGDRHSPVPIAEWLVPGGSANPVLGVLGVLAVAIGVPFFVASTSAPLVQKWFAFTGHPSARDPYFLYAASNAGSLISLLGYPLLVEPNMRVVPQTWLFAIGFLGLVGMILVCGWAAANPMGAPPPRKGGKNAPAAPLAPPAEPPPSGWRIAKWITLAFVPSSLMLGVTFHMTTDIASVPLLWVAPLALYLITFIIAFARVPAWFRLVVGNFGPVMILLLVFLETSKVSPGNGPFISLTLHLATFFAVALMCHYELAIDRPGTDHLTAYFLYMSLGGVLGGVFNALVAPVAFKLAYEYQITLVAGCLMVPRLLTGDAEKYAPPTPQEKKIRLALDLVIPVTVALGFMLITKLPEQSWFNAFCRRVANGLFGKVQADMVRSLLVYAVPVMVCFFFVDRPLRFALCVAGILGVSKFREDTEGVVHSERSFFGILKIEDTDSGNYLREKDGKYDEEVLQKRDDGTLLRPDGSWIRKEDGFAQYPDGTVVRLGGLVKRTDGSVYREGGLVQRPDESLIRLNKITYRRLVHGTTLHGTQIHDMTYHALDDFQQILPMQPWDTLAVAGVIAGFKPKQEPLTYYHRSGPVGAAFRELRTRNGGADATKDVAMVGLGTGSVSCYALPGQKLTFYEIDPAVKKLVADTGEYFTYVKDAEDRGAKLDFRMGDARLKLKEDADRKYSLLLVDAFSSDSIPVHLLTDEAVRLYMNRITDDGLLMVHISNKFIDLEPVVAAITNDLGLAARVWRDNAEGKPGKTASSWVAIAKDEKTLGTLAAPLEEQQGQHGTAFVPLDTIDGMPPWTDDYSDVLRVMMIDEVQTVRSWFGLPTLRDKRR